MSTEILHENPAVPNVREDEEVDPELLALPPPARGQRQLTVALLAVVALIASAMAFSLRSEASYAFARAIPTDLGNIYAFNPAKVETNSYVEAQGSLGGALAVRFERPFESDTYRVSPVMGRRDLWVEVRVPAGEEGARYVPPTSFSGRLVRWSESGLRHRGLETAVDGITSQAIPGDGWLLVDGEAPHAARGTLGLVVMFAGFAVWSAWTIMRLVRKVA